MCVVGLILFYFGILIGNQATTHIFVSIKVWGFLRVQHQLDRYDYKLVQLQIYETSLGQTFLKVLASNQPELF